MLQKAAAAAEVILMVFTCLFRCLQDLSVMDKLWKTFPVKYPSVEQSEDCLYLNVYRPSGASSGDKLPVSGHDS